MRNSIVAICIIVKLGASWNYSHSQNSNGWDGGGEESRAGAVLITASALRTGNTGDTGDRILLCWHWNPNNHSIFKIQDTRLIIGGHCSGE